MHAIKSSSSDRIDGRGPLRQPSPGVSTTASPGSGPLGANAKRCAVGHVMKPRVAWATCSPAPTGRAGASSDCRDLRQRAMGWRVAVESLPHGRTVSFASWWWCPWYRAGWWCWRLLYFWWSHASVTRDHTLAAHVEDLKLPYSVSLPAEVSMLPNRTVGWTIYRSGISWVSSAVEAETVAGLCS